VYLIAVLVAGFWPRRARAPDPAPAEST
jgi:hypothetical protein